MSTSGKTQIFTLGCGALVPKCQFGIKKRPPPPPWGFSGVLISNLVSKMSGRSILRQQWNDSDNGHFGRRRSCSKKVEMTSSGWKRPLERAPKAGTGSWRRHHPGLVMKYLLFFSDLGVSVCVLCVRPFLLPGLGPDQLGHPFGPPTGPCRPRENVSGPQVGSPVHRTVNKLNAM